MIASQWFRKSTILLFLLAFATGARAAIIYSEPFDYGNSNATLAGLSGGTGFSTAWMQQNPGIVYTPTGLTFSDIPVSGGSAYATGTNDIPNALLYRSLTNTLGGTYYGMYLTSAIQSNSASIDELMAGIALNAPPQAPFPGFSGYGIQSPFNSNGLAVTAFSGARSGDAPDQGQTYLVLFKLDTVAEVLTAWVLSPAQYDSIKTNGITETTLDAPAVGNASNQIWAWATATNSMLGMPITASQIGIYMEAPGGVGASFAMDELRLSDTSLAEAISGNQPSLQIAQSGGVALLSWSTNFPGFVLQQTSALNATNWTTVSNAPTVTGSSYVCPIDVTNAAFFRLKK
jgi:hypothetical protein